MLQAAIIAGGIRVSKSGSWVVESRTKGLSSNGSLECKVDSSKDTLALPGFGGAKHFGDDKNNVRSTP